MANARLFVALVMVNKCAKFERASFKDTKVMTKVKVFALRLLHRRSYHNTLSFLYSIDEVKIIKH